MGRPAPRFYQVDLKRAVGVMQKSGVRSYRVDIQPNGAISIMVGDAASTPVVGNSCDDLLD
jgi:hypothetical protein